MPAVLQECVLCHVNLGADGKTSPLASVCRSCMELMDYTKHYPALAVAGAINRVAKACERIAVALEKDARTKQPKGALPTWPK